MALDFSGIENIEFYSTHYLTAVLEGDLRAVFERWNKEKEEHGRRLPQDALAGLSNRYFTARGRAEGERDPVERLRLAQDFHAYLLEALGYKRAPGVEPLDDDDVCPVHLALRKDGQPFLWVLDAPFPANDDDDPLSQTPLNGQAKGEGAGGRLPTGETGEPATWRELLDARLFRTEHPPRWVLFLSGSQVLLIERYKWPQGRYLRFDFSELFKHRQTAAMRAVAGLLHRDVLAPETGLCLHDTLDENSHKHAFAVSSDLKHGVRRAVELLANEAVHYRREVQHLALYQDEELAGKLTAESLTWLYRLLFLFFVEARGADVDIVPMRSDVYRMGYSLEGLRDLELVPLMTEQARNGFFIHESLQQLFRIVNQGFRPATREQPGLAFDEQHHNTMMVDALNSPLFDNSRLEVLKSVRFRNIVMQEVLQLLSLSAEQKSKTRGRISYAQLGINQLGAVYEGILSYTGFFATEDLYEVASEEDCEQLSGKAAAEREALKTYFVLASRIGDYKDCEIVRDENSRKVVHKKGSFIFRLAGRNREKSASYYTPEVLTRCLVKYALKELLYDYEGRRKKTADEILALTICEPAMGSSAFLIEAVDQLSEAYLDARTEELGQTIPPDDYQREKRRVKARLATNNCYGVDLNPTAVELAKVSLWLATMYSGEKCPWFGLRLATGNSLIGARRETYKTADVTRKGTKDRPNWLGLVPEPAHLYHGHDGPPLDERWTPPSRSKGTIYHFLLPAEGMAAFDKEKVIREVAPEEAERVREWRRKFCKPFVKRDAERLEKISDAVDRLFAQVVRERAFAAQETSDRIPVWGTRTDAVHTNLHVRDQEEVAASLEHGSSAYRRLKLAMDAWCALWFWPLEATKLLPNRETWMAWLELTLCGQVSTERIHKQQPLFEPAIKIASDANATQTMQDELRQPSEIEEARLDSLRALSEAFRERRAGYLQQCGFADVDEIVATDAALSQVQFLAERYHFHHWSLRFAEVFAQRAGFDLILGNPPWVRLAFSESAILSDLAPRISLSDLPSEEASLLREELLREEHNRRIYIGECEELFGLKSYFGSVSNYSYMAHVKANLYKCFLVKSWQIVSSDGSVGLLHPEGVYDDPGGGRLRAQIYPRLFMHAQFSNELKLFPEVGNRSRFSLNCYRGTDARQISFVHVSNLLHPASLEQSWLHDGRGDVPSTKNERGGWNLAGHAKRIVQVDESRLRLFSQFYGDDAIPLTEARLPVVHSQDIVAVLENLSRAERLGPSGSRWATTREWNEGDRQDDGTIRREVGYPADISGLIYSGPHIYIGNPMYQTPNDGCSSHRDYTEIDLLSVGDEYLPRTVYAVDRSSASYERVVPRWNGVGIFDCFRHAHREMVPLVGERTLIPAILPPGAGSLGSVANAVFAEPLEMVLFNAVCSSIVSDFVIRSMGRGHIAPSDLQRLPMLNRDDPRRSFLNARCLRLNCISKAYGVLWTDLFEEAWSNDGLTTKDHRASSWDVLGKRWSTATPLRSAFERRQALIEIDVLVAVALGLGLDELLAMYGTQFAVLDEHERSWQYDQHGRLVPTSTTAAGARAVNLSALADELKSQVGFCADRAYLSGSIESQELLSCRVRLSRRDADVLEVPERCAMSELLKETEVHYPLEKGLKGVPCRLLGIRYLDPGLEPRAERVYPTPFTRSDRQLDYRRAWAEFERRLGKKMLEGTPV